MADSYLLTADHTNKDHFRREALSGFANPRPFQTALFVTAPGILDILQAEEMGVINRDTTIVAVNYNKEYRRSIVRSLRLGGFRNASVYSKSLESLRLADYFGGQVDYVFADLCGQVNSVILSWLRLHRHQLKNVALTFSIHGRQDAYLQRLKRSFRPSRQDVYLPIISDIQNIPGCMLPQGENQDDNACITLQAIVDVFDDCKIKRVELGGYHEHKPGAEWMGVFKLSLGGPKRGKRFDSIRAIVIPDLQRSTRPWGNVLHISQVKAGQRKLARRLTNELESSTTENRTMNDKNPVMVKAGKKAWETRRANALKNKRSAAARKAWATRRKNGN